MKFKKYINKFDQEQIISLNNDGKNIREIAKIIDIPEKRLAEMIKYFGLNIKKGFTYKTNDDYFDIIDTEAKAYLLGFFVADGCVQKEEKKKNGEVYSFSYRFSLNNSIDDLEIIKLFRNEICPDKQIEHKFNTKGAIDRKEQIAIRWTSKHMFETFQSYNIHPRKTFDENFYIREGVIPDNLYRHFLRGLFDGDGHKAQSSIEICNVSNKFKDQILNFLNKNLDYFNYRINEIKGKTCTYNRFYITGGSKMLSSLSYLFYNDSKFYLKRKYFSV